MKIRKLLFLTFALLSISGISYAGEYKDKFLQLYGKIHSPSSGYFSPEGAPYHSVETLIVEAPDYGHESTSEAYSYYLMLEAYYGMATGDWQPLKTAWATMENYAIPKTDMQPTNQFYNPSSPATLAFEYDQPSSYPALLQFGVPVGKDPISKELATTYGDWNIFGMHWLFDVDNIYKYGNKGDGVSKPSYINSFQRGKQESVWETVPHPSWESFNWGGVNGFLPLFTKDQNYSKQWRYTNAPDADARVVQVMYWVYQWLLQQGKDPSTELPDLFGKTAKMADYLRLAMFDKYFKKLGSQNPQATGSGYDSAHYLLSWYYAWGGSLVTQSGWAWRIGCSHAHFGYQNPIAAYALTNIPALKPKSPNGSRDWQQSLQRQIEFYTWLQSKDGGIAGGATNSWNGRYETYPSQTPTFYGMAYVENPVYEDPGSGQWFGWQAWSMERLAEYLYVSKNEAVRPLLSKWVKWALSQIRINNDGSYDIPATLKWTGQPYTWDPTSPKVNDGLTVTVVDYNKDIGISASLAKAFMFFAASDNTSLGATAKSTAKILLDGLWNFHQTNIGLAAAEERPDYKRFNDPVYVPQDFTGKMATGAAIQPGATFLSLRPFYLNDPSYTTLANSLSQGVTPMFTYHRFWAQAEAASALLQYEKLFSACNGNCPPTATPLSVGVYSGGSVKVTLQGQDEDGTVVQYAISNYPQYGQVTVTGNVATYTPNNGYVGNDYFEYLAIDNDGLKSGPAKVSVTVSKPSITITAPTGGSVFAPGQVVDVLVTRPAGFGVALYMNSQLISQSMTLTKFSVALPGTEGTQVLEARLLDAGGQTLNYNSIIQVTTKKTTAIDCTILSESVWYTGFVTYLRVKNNSGKTITSWQVEVQLGVGEGIQNYWNGKFTSLDSQRWLVENLSYNGTINSGNYTDFGFVGQYKSQHVPVKCQARASTP